MLSDILESLPAKSAISLSPAEKKSLEPAANMVSIVRAVEQLEKQFVSGLVISADYEKACNTLISQFKVQQASLKTKYPDFSLFWKEHNLLDCTLASERLLSWGVPANLLYNNSSKADPSLHVFDACQGIMTLTDSLRMNLRSCDELLPTLKEVLASVNKIKDLPNDLDSKEKVIGWLQILNQMSAEDQLGEAQARRFALDVETFYQALHAWLKER